jgi:hypothetical protein
MNRNCKKPENRSTEIQIRQSETCEREKSVKCSSATKLKSVSEENKEGIKLKTRGRRQFVMKEERIVEDMVIREVPAEHIETTHLLVQKESFMHQKIP